jgi:hypothetical protein
MVIHICIFFKGIDMDLDSQADKSLHQKIENHHFSRRKQDLYWRLSVPRKSNKNAEAFN